MNHSSPSIRCIEKELAMGKENNAKSWWEVLRLLVPDSSLLVMGKSGSNMFQWLCAVMFDHGSCAPIINNQTKKILSSGVNKSNSKKQLRLRRKKRPGSGGLIKGVSAKPTSRPHWPCRTGQISWVRNQGLMLRDDNDHQPAGLRKSASEPSATMVAGRPVVGPRN